MKTSLHRERAVLTAIALAIVIVGTSSTIVSQRRRSRVIASIDGHDAVAGEVIVRLKNALNDKDKHELALQLDADESESIAPGLKRIRSRSFDARTLLDYLRTHRLIEYAEPNYVVHTARVPSDPKFPTLWGLRNTGQTIGGVAGLFHADVHATDAWELTTGTRANVVAVIDTGIDYTHPDLVANMWSAPAAFTVTIGGQSIRCAAGTHGFDAILKTCDPRDDNDHGTHVAGIIGAAGNNAIGVTGVNWKTSLMAVKFLDESGEGTVADAINAIEFAIQTRKAFAATNGANVRVLSNSWSGAAYSRALLDEINRANTNNMLFVAAAGNGVNGGDGDNNRTDPSYPGSYKGPNLITVAASNNQDRLAAFSNYGSGVQLAAPGVNIQSTTIGNTYKYMSGTSMAAPFVSGAAALLLAKCPLDSAGLRRSLMDNVDRIGALTGWVYTGGRLNVDRSLRSCVAAASGAKPAAPTSVWAVSAPGAGQVTVTWSAVSGAITYNVKKSLNNGGPYSTVGTGLTSRSFVADGITGRRYYFVVTAVNGAGEGPNSKQVTEVGK